MLSPSSPTLRGEPIDCDVHSIVSVSQVIRKIDLEVVPTEYRHCRGVLSQQAEDEVFIARKVHALERSLAIEALVLTVTLIKTSLANILAIAPKRRLTRSVFLSSG